jgi:hypothetical protein
MSRIARVAAFAALATVAVVVAACSSGATPAPSTAPSIRPSTDPGGVTAEALASTIPTQVGDIELTVTSGDLPTLEDDLPNYDDLVLNLRNADIEPEDVLGAIGKPTDGSADPRVGALQIIGAPPGGIGLLGLMEAWVSSIPGATTTNGNVGGKPVVIATFDDGSAPLYYYLSDRVLSDQEIADTMYYVRSADEAVAAEALSLLP